MLAKLHTFSLLGIEAVPVDVEVDVSAAAMPKTILVGLPEAAVKESTHRVDRAMVNSGFQRPHDRVVINLAPAELPKQAASFDLPITLGVLAGSGQLTSDRFEHYALVGELFNTLSHYDDDYSDVRGQESANHYLLALDGTGYFSSQAIHCASCLQKVNKTTGEVMVGAAIVHPDRREVIPLAPEPIQKQDGSTKNDCERNATRRLLEKIRRQHPRLKLIVTEDGLSSNAPHVRDLLEYGMHFILGVKPGDHTFLFEQVEARRRGGRAPKRTWKEGPRTCEASWAYSATKSSIIQRSFSAHRRQRTRRRACQGSQTTHFPPENTVQCQRVASEFAKHRAAPVRRSDKATTSLLRRELLSLGQLVYKTAMGLVCFTPGESYLVCIRHAVGLHIGPIFL